MGCLSLPLFLCGRKYVNFSDNPFLCGEVSASPECKKGGKNEGHVHLLLGYPLVCFKLPCLFGTSTETDVALSCWIIYCTSWCRMEGLPSYPAGLTGALACAYWSMTTASTGCSFIMQLSFFSAQTSSIYIGMVGGCGLGRWMPFSCLFILVVDCRRPTQALASSVDHNVTHYFCHLRIIGMIAQS